MNHELEQQLRALLADAAELLAKNDALLQKLRATLDPAPPLPSLEQAEAMLPAPEVDERLIRAPLLRWINTHDCGVTPTGVRNPDGSITIRGIGVGPDGAEVELRDVVWTLEQARAVLGY